MDIRDVGSIPSRCSRKEFSIYRHICTHIYFTICDYVMNPLRHQFLVNRLIAQLVGALQQYCSGTVQVPFMRENFNFQAGRSVHAHTAKI